MGRAYAMLAERDARRSFLHTLRSVVDHEGQRVTALDRLDLTKRFPSLIVWGERDRIVPAEHGRQVHQLVPNTYLAMFERAGHFPHRDDPDRFVQVVDEFLASTRRSPACIPREQGGADAPAAHERGNAAQGAVGARACHDRSGYVVSTA
jgi:hypothetical protein